MIRAHFIISCLLFYASFGLTQNRFFSNISQNLNEHPDYVQYLNAKQNIAQIIEAELKLLNNSIESDNFKFYFRKTIEDMMNSREESLKDQLNLLTRKAKIKLPASNFRNLLELEAQLLAINRKLHRIESYYENQKPIKITKDFLEEFNFYNIKPGDKIGELGAGNGNFGFAIVSTLDAITYYANEVDSALLHKIAYKSKFHNNEVLPISKFYPILGSAVSTGFEEVNMDVILIRNAIHHFEYLESMLLSIRRSLRQSGTIYLKERFPESCIYDCCPDLMKEEELVLSLAKVGFVLKEKQVFKSGKDTWWILAFELIVN